MDIKANETIDCIGLYCPMPVVKAKLKLEEMADGQVLEIIADDPGAKKDFPAWCESTGNELMNMEEKNGVITVYIRKRKIH